ncbi:MULTISPECIES: hypothetical protein [unclassified Streptomyces]|uniref:hypothetical protein n=1 Tax=unclassified Streptomyces TaxID=2593676 RepID=UPI00131A19C7|nr:MULTISPECIES: hypothetical protein [unclassified Streptomyces]MYX34847.1 hypothetical protein [Streptomyces sp. SID8377]
MGVVLGVALSVMIHTSVVPPGTNLLRLIALPTPLPMAFRRRIYRAGSFKAFDTMTTDRSHV